MTDIPPRFSDREMLPPIEIDGETVRVLGRHHALVGSLSHPGEFHSVEVDDHTGEWTCTCAGNTFGHRQCRHITRVKGWLKGDLEARIIEE